MTYEEAGERGRWKDPSGPLQRYKKTGWAQQAWNELPKHTANFLKLCTANVEHYIMSQTSPATRAL